MMMTSRTSVTVDFSFVELHRSQRSSGPPDSRLARTQPAGTVTCAMISGLAREHVTRTTATLSSCALADDLITTIVAGRPRYLATSATTIDRPAASRVRQPISLRILMPPNRALGDAGSE